MKVVNKLRILSSVIPSLIQSCEVAGIRRAMVSYSPFGSFLHFQLDNWHFFGFILWCTSTVLWWWPNRRLLQMLLCLKGTLLLTRRHFLLSGWVLGDSVVSFFLFPHLFPVFLLLHSLHKFRQHLSGPVSCFFGACGGNKLGLMQQLAAFCPLSNTTDAARCRIVMQKWSFPINQVDYLR